MPQTDSIAVNRGSLACADSLRNKGIVRLFRRAMYFFFAGMAVYLLSWSTVLCRVIRGVAQYPDDMPNAVWITTIGLLLFYETFILAQATSMATRIRQAFAAQRPLFAGKGSWQLHPEHTVLSAFATESRVYTEDGYRDYVYLLFIFICSLPDWKAIAFLAGGAAIDLISAVLYSVPSIRDFFGMPEDQQRAEPWATMTFLLVIWLVVISLTGWWEKNRHTANADSDNADSDKELEQLVGGAGNNFGNREGATRKGSSTAEDATQRGYRLLGSFDSLSTPQQILVGVAIYCGAGVGIFFAWGYIVMKRLEGVSEIPWAVALITVAFLLFWQVCRLGKWRMLAAHKERRLVEKDASVHSQITTFARYHTWARNLHLCLVAFSVFIGMAASDRDWLEDYLLLKRPAFFFTQDWQAMRDIQDDADLKQSLLNASTTIGIDAQAKIAVGYCASSTTLPVYFIFVCVGWSLFSSLQHHLSARTLSSCLPSAAANGDSVDQSAAAVSAPTARRPGRVSWKVYLLLVTAAMAALVWPAFKRRGFSWQSITIAAIVAGPVVLILQVALLGVWDLFPDHSASDTGSPLARAHAALRTVRTYKWIEYTVSATLMHVVVCYVGGVTGAHELVLCAGCLATSMLFSSMTEAELDTMETEQQQTTLADTARNSTILTLEQRIGCEKSFLYLSFWAKSILCVALTVPWVFVERGDFVFQPTQCNA